MIISPPGPTHAHPFPPESSAWSCQQRLSQVTGDDLQQLYRYAAQRMAKLNLPSVSGEDLAHDAVRQVLHGTLVLDHGRHPRACDLVDVPAFLRYLRWVIHSLIEAEYRRGAERYQLGLVEELADLPDEAPGIQLVENVTPRDLVGFSQLSQELFRRLKARVPERLQTLVATWESHSDLWQQIPSEGRSRKDRHCLRRLAQQVYRELQHERPSQSSKPSSPTAT